MKLVLTFLAFCWLGAKFIELIFWLYGWYFGKDQITSIWRP